MTMAQRPLVCVILAAGKGTRMVSSLPKVLHPIGHWPMIQHIVRTAEMLKPEKIIVVVAAGMADVEAAVKPHPTVIQREQLGTGDAVKAAYQHMGGFDGDVLILFGDTPLLTERSLQQLLDTRNHKDNPAVVIYGMRPEDPLEYGRLIVQGNQVDAIIEYKDASPEQRKIPLCNAGVMLLDGQRMGVLLDALTPDNQQHQYYLVDVVKKAREKGWSCAFVEGPAEDVLGVNSRAELAVAEGVFQNRQRSAAMAAGVTLQDPATVYFSADTVIGQDVVVGPHVFFGPGTVVEKRVTILSFTHIEGATVREGAQIGPFARLRPGTVVESHAKVGNFVETKNAHIGPGSKVNHLSYVGDASVGEKTNIGAGTITCNYDGYDKHKTTIGAGVMVGSNTSLVAPVSIGDGAYIGAGSVVTEDVPADALAVARAKGFIRSGWAATFRARKKR